MIRFVLVCLLLVAAVVFFKQATNTTRPEWWRSACAILAIVACPEAALIVWNWHGKFGH